MGARVQGVWEVLRRGEGEKENRPCRQGGDEGNEGRRRQASGGWVTRASMARTSITRTA